VFSVSCLKSKQGRSGGLCLLWKEDVCVALQTYSLNHIDVLVGRSGGGGA
jgi:hypothetical protein